MLKVKKKRFKKTLEKRIKFKQKSHIQLVIVRVRVDDKNRII